MSLSIPLGVWVAGGDEEARLPVEPVVARVATSGPEPEAHAGGRLVETPPPAPVLLPPDLAVRRASVVSRDQAVAIVSSSARSGGERLVALRGLARADPAAAVVEAEAAVLRADSSREERALAANALGLLARTPGGHAALERCASSASSEDLRRAAQVLLTRLR